VEIYLHHYPASLFSEKIRVLLGFLGLSWHSVITSSIMPRPLLMPLTGGYRKTPNLQIGANVYSDTAVIARGLARHVGDSMLSGAGLSGAGLFGAGFNGDRIAEWADTQLFRVTVTLNFRPEALGEMMSQLSADEISAFMADRAQLSEGASITTFTPAAAFGYLADYATTLEASLADNFLFGAMPTIADFSVYHCFWFVAANPINAPLLEPYPEIRAWMARMAAFGHGEVSEASAEQALAHARDSEPLAPALDSTLPVTLPEGIAIGDAVSVTPVDYGRIPVTGQLVAWSPNEIVVARETNETGALMNHFPSAGFEVAALS
jgi:glutathione S-transferase